MKLNYLIAIPVAILVMLILLSVCVKARAGDLSPHFDTSEFTCNCCGEGGVQPELIEKLELLREKIGKPIIVTSGYRCEKHNKHVGGVANSYHLLGMAADIKVKGIKPCILAQVASNVGFFVIIYDNFVHLDIGERNAKI